MITVHAVGYQFLNRNGIDMNRKNGSGDYLFLHFRCATEVFLDGHYQLVPENSFFLFEKDAPQVYRKTDGIFLNDWILLTREACIPISWIRICRFFFIN